jgi:hypothetical protein
MKLGKILIAVGLIAVGILSLNLQARAGSPPTEGFAMGDDEYWGVLIINCVRDEVYLRVKRVVDCVVETDALIESNVPQSDICDLIDIDAGIVLNQYMGYSGVIFNIQGVPIITKVKNLNKDNYSASGGYQGDIYSMDVQIRFCTNCTQ